MLAAEAARRPVKKTSPDANLLQRNAVSSKTKMMMAPMTSVAKGALVVPTEAWVAFQSKKVNSIGYRSSSKTWKARSEEAVVICNA